MTYKLDALELLRKSNGGMSVIELTSGVKGSCGSTIARALRKLRSEGYVDRFLIGPHGLMQWHVHPNAVFPYRSPAQQRKNNTQTTVPKSFKGSSRKATVMCLPQNKPTLVTAAFQAIDTFVADKKKFSAHDVTSKLREMVKDNTVHVDEAETGVIHAYGKKLPRIAHDDVRDIVHDSFLTGKMPGYDRTLDGDHWVYESTNTTQPTPVPPIILVVPADDYKGDPTL